jgi:hypothetical protein
MGTSNSYGGPGGGTPLVPSWVGAAAGAGAGATPGVPVPPAASPPGVPAPPVPVPAVPVPAAGAPAVPPAPVRPPIPVAGAAGRFASARKNFTSFAKSGGTNRAALGRAVSGYVSKATGGAHNAAQRMGASRMSAGRLVGFLANAQSNGTQQALQSLNLGQLAGRTIGEIFLGMVDYICPQVATVDEGIARSAFIETIIDLAGLGIADLDALNPDQIQTVLALYATNAIEARICNDIGNHLVNVPANAATALLIQEQLHDFIRNGVDDSLSAALENDPIITQGRAQALVEQVYEDAFGLLEVAGDEMANQ